MLVIVLSWVLFRAESFGQAFHYYKVLFGFSGMQLNDIKLIFKIDSEVITYFLIAVFGVFGIFPYLQKHGTKFLAKVKLSDSFKLSWDLIFKLVFLLVVLILSTGALVNNSYNPFIYFRF